jgi:hypothetical protein
LKVARCAAGAPRCCANRERRSGRCSSEATFGDSSGTGRRNLLVSTPCMRCGPPAALQSVRADLALADDNETSQGSRQDVHDMAPERLHPFARSRVGRVQPRARRLPLLYTCTTHRCTGVQNTASVHTCAALDLYRPQRAGCSEHRVRVPRPVIASCKIGVLDRWLEPAAWRAHARARPARPGRRPARRFALDST